VEQHLLLYAGIHDEDRILPVYYTNNDCKQLLKVTYFIPTQLVTTKNNDEIVKY